MGYAVYDDQSGLDRFSGYGVPAYCDVPECRAEIDRGMGYRCESYFTYSVHEPTGEEAEEEREGCGLQFCAKHLDHEEHGDNVVWDGREHPDWVKHLLTDDSWAHWRERNTAQVKRLAGLS